MRNLKAPALIAALGVTLAGCSLGQDEPNATGSPEDISITAPDVSGKGGTPSATPSKSASPDDKETPKGSESTPSAGETNKGEEKDRGDGSARPRIRINAGVSTTSERPQIRIRLGSELEEDTDTPTPTIVLPVPDLQPKEEPEEPIVAAPVPPVPGGTSGSVGGTGSQGGTTTIVVPVPQPEEPSPPIVIPVPQPEEPAPPVAPEPVVPQPGGRVEDGDHQILTPAVTETQTRFAEKYYGRYVIINSKAKHSILDENKAGATQIGWAHNGATFAATVLPGGEWLRVQPTTDTEKGGYVKVTADTTIRLVPVYNNFPTP